MIQNASVRASLKRIKERSFTEADVRTVLIEMREHAGPLIREVGDLIAHPQRDRGVTFSYLIHCLSRMTMFVKYLGTDKIPFPVDGSCDWWLKDWLLSQAGDFDDREIKGSLSVKRKQIKREIEGYFPPKPFPDRLSKPCDQRLVDIINFLCTRIKSQPAFPYSQTRKEVQDLLINVGLPVDSALIDDFVVCICMLFHGSKFILPNGSKGECEFCIEPRPPEVTERDGRQYAILSPHGSFGVNATADVAHSPKGLRVSFPLIDTAIQTDDYVDDALIKVDEHNIRRIDLRSDLQFSRDRQRPLGPVDVIS